MTVVSAQRPTVAYVPGPWPALVSERLVVLAELDPAGPALTACWGAVAAGLGLDDVLAALDAAAPAEPSLAALGFEPDGLRLVVRGRAVGQVIAADGSGPVSFAPDGGTGLLDRRLSGVRELRLLAAGAAGDGPHLPMTGGVSLASAVVLALAETAEPRPADRARSTTGSTVSVPIQRPDPPAAQPSPVLGPGDLPTRPATDTPRAFAAPSLPWRPPQEFHPNDDSGVQPLLGGPVPDASGAGSGNAPQSPAPQYDVPRYGSPDYAFVSPPTPAQSAERPFEPPVVQAVQCPNGHLNPPFVVGACRVCGVPVPHQNPFAARRPTMGRLQLSTGGTIPLDRDVVLGRAPFVVDPDGSHVISVPSPNNDISRSHVRVGIDGWLVQVTDLGSTNGTLVTVPGQQPVRLRPHDPFTILAGTVISLADEVGVLFEVTE